MTTVYEYAFISGPPHQHLLTVRKSAPLAHVVPGAQINFPRDTDADDDYQPMLDYVIVSIEQRVWPGQEPHEQKLWVKVKLVD
jgi:hypothetical protein